MPTRVQGSSKTTASGTQPKAATGLSAGEKARFARGLIGADLAHARAQASALKSSANAGRAQAPAQAAHLVAVASDRLALISAEQKARTRLQGKLSSGQTGDAYAKTLATRSGPELTALLNQLQGSKSADAPLQHLAVQRELDHRQSQADAASAAQEQVRLDGVKHQYEQFLTGKSPQQLEAEQTAELARVAADQKLLATATASGNAAQVALASKNLRTEYAREAVLLTRLPPIWDHQALHDYANQLKGYDLPHLQEERTHAAAALAALTGGVVRGGRKELGNATVKLAIIDAAIARKSRTGGVATGDPTRIAGNKVFEGPGMFVADASAYPAGAYAQKLKAAGVTWVALQVHNPGAVAGNVDAVENGWADAWRAAGFKVGFWGVSYGNAADDAKTAADLTAQLHGDFYIADCEGAFQAGEGDPARNKQFVDAFQAEANARGIGKIPRALSSMGRVALDMKPWIDDGWDAMPQAYWNSHAVYQPSLCVQFYEQTGWPKGRIHPTIATYDAAGEHGDVPGGKQVKDYVADLEQAGTTGVSYYLPESYLDDAEYQQWIAGMAAGMNGPRADG